MQLSFKCRVLEANRALDIKEVGYKYSYSSLGHNSQQNTCKLRAYCCSPTTLAASLTYYFTQLGTGSGTAYNVTLNLTGHILLGIGISLALLIYLFNSAMNAPSASHSSGGGYGGKRSADILHIVKVCVGEFPHALEILLKHSTKFSYLI